MLESALAAGLAAAGADVFLGGVLPTPAAAILVRRHGFDLGAVVSASHNPWQDNGIKFFDRNGRKLDDEAERRVEARVAAGPATGSASGRIRKLEGALDDYLRELGTASSSISRGRKIVLDCANGATYRAAPAVFERLGADVVVDRRRARRAQHQRGLRLDPPRATSPPPWPRPRPRSASPSTATATGCSPSTRDGRGLRRRRDRRARRDAPEARSASCPAGPR